MRRKKQKSLQENSAEPPITGNRKLKFDSSNEATIANDNALNDNQNGKSKNRKSKYVNKQTKNARVVSGYFTTTTEENQGEPSQVIIKGKNNKESKTKSNVDIKEINGKASDEENEFEEQSILHRSPSMSRPSKRKSRKNDQEPTRDEKKCAKKRKSDENDTSKPAKKARTCRKEKQSEASTKKKKNADIAEDTLAVENRQEEELEIKRKSSISRGKRKTSVDSKDTTSETSTKKKKNADSAGDSLAVENRQEEELEIKRNSSISRGKRKTSVDSNDTASDRKRKKPATKSTRDKAKPNEETTDKLLKNSTKRVDKGEKTKFLPLVKENSTKRVIKGEKTKSLPLVKENSAKRVVKGEKTKSPPLAKEDSTESLPAKKKPTMPSKLDHTDVTAVLMHMEGIAKAAQPSTSTGATGVVDDDVMSDFNDDSDAESVDEDKESDGSEEDWEEVEDHHGSSPKKSQIPDKPVEFTLEAPLLHRKKKRGEFDWKAYLRRKMNRFKKEVAMEIHKVHLLCLTARCSYLNNLYTDDLLKAQAMSVAVVTRELTLVSVERCSTDQLVKLFSWLQQTYSVSPAADKDSTDTQETLRGKIRQCLQTRRASSHIVFISVCVLLLRQIGFRTRLVMSLQPLPFKESGAKTTNKGKAPARKSNNKTSKQTKSDKGASKTGKAKANSRDSASKPSSGKTDKVTKAKNSTSKKGKSAKANSETRDSKAAPDSSRSRRRCSKDLPDDVYRVEADEADSEDEYDPKLDEDSGEEKDNKKGKGKARHKKENISSQSSVDTDEGSDDDFEDSILIRSQSLKRKSPGSKNKKVLSSDSDSSADNYKGADEWLEVYLEKEGRWIYGSIKDVTQRYASQWLTSTRKLRVDGDWWTETMEPYRSGDAQQDRLEDQDIQNSLQRRPLPTSVGDFKSHPLYALQRHLLKFEAIYPPSAVPLGYIRGEPVYARECVYTLHSRENWLKEGRAVRIGEEAYKHVKSRAKWNRPKENPEAKDLEIFGIWQTELYIPPPAVDGKVPRNTHGNVEMFLPSMLPAGTVHLKLPGLNKIAKKLDIDCAPAMVGWDHHCGFSHPLMDGWIVCEEFKDIMLAAWDEEQEIIQEREAVKREKRVYDNWRKLIRGLLIRERLKKRFDLDQDKDTAATETSKEEKKKDIPKPGKVKLEVKSEVNAKTVPEKATDTQYAWPRNRIKNETTTYKMEEI